MAAVLLMLVTGGIVYLGLVLEAARRHRRRTEAALASPPPAISVLKPLAGLEPELEENLASFFRIGYPDFEILFAVREAEDPAAGAAQRLIERYRGVPARLIVAGEPPSLADYPNAKAWSLIQAAREARGEILVISDSDIRADAGYLAGIAASFTNSRTGVATCPYRAVAGPSPWSRMEAVGMNTEFWSGVLVAQMLAPMDFAVGPTMAVRRECLEALGGFEAVREYLAEDFVLGRMAREQTYEAVLTRHAVEHRIGSQGFTENLRHRIRWQRSTRRSRPAGYAGQVLTNPLPLAAALVAVAGGAAWAWGVFAVCAAMRAAAAAAVARGVLGARLNFEFWALLPLQDAASLAVWLLGFFGRTIVWRGRRFELLPDGRLRPR